MRYVLGIDFGGSASKGTLLSEKGEVISTASAEYPMHYPHNGWAEQDVEDIYEAFLKVVGQILEKSGVCPEDIIALALDAGTHIAVLLDKNNQVIRPAIYWSDNRSARQAQMLKEREKEIARITYNMPAPLWTLPQLIWISENEPESFKKINKIIFLKDYIRFRLTGTFETDSIDAMGSMLLDVPNQKWSESLCSLCGLSPDKMVSIVSPDTVVGTVSNYASETTGLSTKTLVVAGTTDTVMEVFASGAIAKGQATLKIATAGRICVITDKPFVDPLLVCYQHIIPGLWYPGTTTKTCATSMRWYRDVLGRYEKHMAQQGSKSAYELIDEEASKTPPGSDGLFFHPYLQGEITPHMDTSLRGSFTNISTFHTKGHFGRAVMEGVAYSLRDCMEVVKALGMEISEEVRFIGGGSKSNIWGQIVADVLGLPLLRVKTDDSSIGSAMLAGVASGVFASYEDSVKLCTKTAETIYPNSKNKNVYDEGFGIYRSIQRAMAPIYRKINQ